MAAAHRRRNAGIAKTLSKDRKVTLFMIHLGYLFLYFGNFGNHPLAGIDGEADGIAGI